MDKPTAPIEQQTPAEIDTYLWHWAQVEGKARAYATNYAEIIERAEAKGQHVYASYREALAKYTAEAEAARAEQQPGEREYVRRGYWERSFLVIASNGHAHRSMHCSTCFPTTSFTWLPELSGLTEAEIVEEAGERACTVCYPSAPVDVLKRASRLRPDVEARAARAATNAARAAAKAAKAAKAITAPDGSPLRVDGWVVASEVTARNGYVAAAAEAADHAEGVTSWGHRPDLAAKYGAEADQLLAALAAKHGVSVEEEAVELAPKVAARRKKDARERAKYAR